MRIKKYKKIEYTEIYFSELGQELRFDADYWQPMYLRNEARLKKKAYTEIKTLAPYPQYGISIAMNEDGKGYRILKMDDIIGVLANDFNCKYAEVSSQTLKIFKLNKYDVLFNRVNSDEFVGRTGIYLIDGEHIFASYIVRINTGKSYTNCYITTFLNCQYGKTSLQRVKRRAVNQANINAKELGNLCIPIPSETFQKTIEKLIIKAFKRKENCKNLYQEAENILLEEIGLKDYKTQQRKYNINGITCEVDETINEVYFNEVQNSDRYDAEYWEKNLEKIINKIKDYKKSMLIKDACNIDEKLTKPVNHIEYKYIELANIDNYGIIKDYIKDYGKNLPTRARRLVKTNQVIISSIEGSLSSCAIIPKSLNNSFCSTGFYVVDPCEINSETLLILLRTEPFQKLLKRGCAGTILTAIPNKEFKQIRVPIIVENIQKQVKNLIKQSMENADNSRALIEIAIKAVEIFIKGDQKEANSWLNEEIKKMGDTLIC